jgi:hypothetical protein
MNEVTVNLDNLTAEERKQLLALVGKANKPFEVWKPFENVDIFKVCADGSINSYRYYSPEDVNYYTQGRLFQTREQAEFFSEQERILTQYKRLAAESWTGEKIDWSDFDINKWEACLRNNELDYTTIYNGRYVGGVYFKTEESLKSAIKTIGEENIIKYLF